MSEEVTAQILSPFGPRMLKTKFPQELIERLNAHCDDMLSNPKHDVSDQLVGHVQQEVKCEVSKIAQFGQVLFQATNGLYSQFMAQTNAIHEPPNQIQVHNAWFVRSFATDYNPVHIHTSGQFSCILYLKLPESIGEKNWKFTEEKYASEGWTDFLFGVTQLCSVGSFRVKPEVGDFYVFPSYLSHCVYPFYGEGERRSFSANLTLTKVDKTD